MALLDWLFGPRARERERVRELEKRVETVERQIRRLSEDKPSCPPLVIQHAEKVVVERVDYSSHFGTLDIDSLSGQLNIGLNVQRPLGPDEPLPGFASPARPPGGPAFPGLPADDPPPGSLPHDAKPQGPPNSGPACHIRPRRPFGGNGEKPAESAGDKGASSTNPG
ncbi:hypothetical protein [Cohnella caldifontis]|uniref:hypothetical protein n=1 Tax=Cohnella caldifontis TaxID=3027471 RepID=UPI0023EB5C52|nr:hypothetical protein [Cohnella sp. YIM B05605]